MDLPNASELLTIAGMCVATYSSRLLGWALLRGRALSTQSRSLLDAAPGCVMAAIIGPYFLTTSLADLVALFVALLLARRANLAVIVLAAVSTSALLRQLL